MNELISELVGYGIEKGLVEEDDKIYVINRLLELFRLDSYTQTDKAIRQLSEILSDMTDYAAEHGLIPENTNVYRDLFDTKIMGILTPAPSVVRAKFTDLYVKNPSGNGNDTGRLPAGNRQRADAMGNEPQERVRPMAGTLQCPDFTSFDTGSALRERQQKRFLYLSCRSS